MQCPICQSTESVQSRALVTDKQLESILMLHCIDCDHYWDAGYYDSVSIYDDDYAKHYLALSGTMKSVALNMKRAAFVTDHRSYGNLTDIGCGVGAFLNIVGQFDCYTSLKGYDINSTCVAITKNSGFDAESTPNGLPEVTSEVVTFFDTLEHFRSLTRVMGKVANAEVIVITIPLFTDYDSIEKSHHFKPGEHLHYFTDKSIQVLFKRYLFSPIKWSDFEDKVGRRGLRSYLFERVTEKDQLADKPTYADYMAEKVNNG